MSNSAIVRLENAIFKPLSDAARTSSIFKKPLSLTINQNERWAITGPRKSQFLQILSSRYIAHPPLSRTYPFLSKDFWPSQVTELLEFAAGSNIKATHLSARYEHFRDEFDQSLIDFLRQASNDESQIETAIDSFLLQGLQNRWVVGLSNGQNRRARLAFSTLKSPKMLFVDEPFLGLDPTSRQKVASALGSLPPNPHVVLGLRIQDSFPEWITHAAIVNDEGILSQGTINDVKPEIDRLHDEIIALTGNKKGSSVKKMHDDSETIIKIDNISVAYRGQSVLKSLSWDVKRGERWHVQGSNGSGKSTLLSLLTADHPQSWNSKIVLFGEPRKTGKHSYFGINEAFGHVAPEIHGIFPTHYSVYKTVASGYVVGLLSATKALSETQKQRLESLLEEFGFLGGDVDPHSTRFGDLSLSDQKVVLFLRGIIRRPEILILDEAFSAMEEHRIEKCKQVIREYPGTVLVVGHLENEIPECDHYIRLKPDAGGIDIGRL